MQNLCPNIKIHTYAHSLQVKKYYVSSFVDTSEIKLSK